MFFYVEFWGGYLRQKDAGPGKPTIILTLEIFNLNCMG